MDKYLLINLTGFLEPVTQRAFDAAVRVEIQMDEMIKLSAQFLLQTWQEHPRVDAAAMHTLACLQQNRFKSAFVII